MTYPEIVKADVARRYGCPVLCEVKIVPRGVSGLPEFAPKPSRRRKQDCKRLKDIEIARTLRGEGLTFIQISERLGVSLRSVQFMFG